MEIALLLFLVLLNGVFAMSEIALVTARRARLQKRVDEGDTHAEHALRLGEDPTRFLSTIQIGITSIGVLNGIVGESVLAEPLGLWLQTKGIEAEAASWLSTGLVVVIITYVTIVLGELVPKRIGQTNPEAIARLVAQPMHWLSIGTRPFVRLLSFSTNVWLRLFGVRTDGGPAVTQEEIHALLAEGSETGVIEEHEHEMVQRVFRLDDRLISSLMVPRSDIIAIDLDDEASVNLQHISESAHSRFPVVRGGWSEVLGIAHAKQILSQSLRGERIDFSTGLQAVVYVPESLTGMELLENFCHSGGQLALVVDEYGEVQGLVTLQDVLEAITGEFQPTSSEEAWATQRADGSWLMDGIIPIPELKERLDLLKVPEEERGRYNTLSGMLMLLLGRVPKTGDTAEWEDWRFEIVDMDGNRIDKVLATAIPRVED